jgi:hypothetical protein
MLSKLIKVVTTAGVVSMLAAIVLTNAALADPCLVVYPAGSCVYHYDPSEYYTVGPSDPFYDPLYDRGGEVLLRISDNSIDLSIYQAPNLVGFVADSVNQGYFTLETDLDIVIDGFSNSPTTYENIILVFDRVEPSWCVPGLTVDGNAVSYQSGLGWYYPIGDLVVSTPTLYGNNYSDTKTVHVSFQNCSTIRIYAFSDVDHDLQRDGGECFSAFSHDTTVPTEDSTWGGIKEMYSE